MYSWKLNNVEWNEYDPGKNPIAPNALYDFELVSLDNGRATMTSYKFSEVQLLMQHFGVNRVEDLKGKSFESESNKYSTAIATILEQQTATLR